MTALTFKVVGHAQPAGSKRHIGGGRVIDANPNAGDWKRDVARVAAEAMIAARLDGELWDGPVGMSLLFSRARPKGHYGTGRNAGVLKPSAPPYPTTKPDSLKLTRGVEDALTGVVWRDDAQVVEQTVMKRWGTPEGVEVRVWTL
jgi:Holliday junction resolvase RusA-like endonuclease